MSQPVRYSRNPWWMAALVSCCLLELCGCSLFVMAGKMIQGDPVIEDEFKKWYGKSLADSEKNVAILCSTPESIKSEYSSLDLDLISEISSRLSRHDVSVIKPHRVASWIDDHGGGELNVQELGSAVDAEFVIHIKLDDFNFREENSPNLLRGRSSGLIVVYELVSGSGTGFEKTGKGTTKKTPAKKVADKKSSGKDEKSSKTVSSKKKDGTVIEVKQVFSRNFNMTYPSHQPVSIDQMEPDMFCKKFVDQVSDEIARLFYRHKAGSDI